MVSIVVPVYNAENYLSNCIESIINQTYKKIEVILIDDGSTDVSAKICDEYAWRDSRIKVIHKKNEGPNLSRQKGLEIAQGEYIMFCDADDELDSEIVTKLVEKMMKEKADVVCFNFIYKGKKGFNIIQEIKYSKEEAIKKMLYRETMDGNMWCKLYRREVLCNPDNITMCDKMHCDFYTMYSIFSRCNNIIVIPECGYYYRDVETSLSHKIEVHPRLEEYEQGAWELHLEIKQKYGRIQDASMFNYLEALLFVCIRMYKTMDFQLSNPRFVMERNKIRRNLIYYVLNRHIPVKDKLEAIFCCLGIRRFIYSLQLLFR